MIITRKWKDVEPKANPHKVDARNIYQDKNALIVHMLLEPGDALLPHKTPVDVVFYVLEGTGTVEIGNEKKEVKKDMLVESPKDIPHSWHNTGKGKLRIMVIKIPNPTRPTKIL
ncbi:MAG: cupin domain-containing protein [Candidatus Marinimicrobia bacterium]|nr:cupin domain-containing protein [Candidatus Neomarinimicrobiota bacterium]